MVFCPPELVLKLHIVEKANLVEVKALGIIIIIIIMVIFKCYFSGELIALS